MSATSCGWEIEQSLTVPGMKSRYDRRVVPAMVNVRGLPYVVPDSMSPNGEESDEQTRAYRKTPAVGDSGDTAATARLRVVPLALFALMVPSYLLRGYFVADFGNQLRGIAVEEADGMLSELAVRSHLEVSLEHGRLHFALWERDAPPYGVLVTNRLIDY